MPVGSPADLLHRENDDLLRLRLPTDLKAALEEEAYRQFIDSSKAARFAIVAWLENASKERSRRSA